MIHLHLTALVLAIILFFITYNSIDYPDGDSKYSKPLHMVLRLVYLINTYQWPHAVPRFRQRQPDALRHQIPSWIGDDRPDGNGHHQAA
ncbi:DUF1516 family protein [Salinicoccus siamensis]|uniref:DUF1516 family protein n=1 Tax=Salinicoccus siamensis TaxID=381830 RepID=UPI00360D74DA